MEQGTGREEKEEERKYAARLQLARNTVTHNSLIRTPKDYDNPYHQHEDYYFSQAFRSLTSGWRLSSPAL